MRIAYACRWNLEAADGVAKKIEAQTSEWRAAGHEVEMFALSPRATRWSATARLARAVDSFQPDLLYVRYDLFLPPVWRLVRRFHTVVEVNSDDRVEIAEWRGRSSRLYNELNRRVVLGAARGLCFVTGELARSEAFARYTAPRVVVANGVVAGPELAPVAHDDGPRAVFLGSAGQPWHGVDKLAALAAALPELHVDVVGYTAEELARAVRAVPQNVRAHGRLARAEYEPLLAAADVGVGTLALHRKHMEEAAPLKVREYLAAGLPVVIAYDDVDLQDVDAWWLLRLPNREGELDGGAVGAFVDAVRGRRVARAEIAPLVSWAPREARRLAFLSAIARGESPQDRAERPEIA